MAPTTWPELQSVRACYEAVIESIARLVRERAAPDGRRIEAMRLLTEATEGLLISDD